jgi:TRAP-type mannitol/chloroaromatic compound transport system permease small subunit
MLAVLAAFLINNVLISGFGVPGVRTLWSGQGGGLVFIPVAIYAGAIVLAAGFVIRTPDRALRWDAMKVHRFNCYLIRAAFWSVLLVGIVDSTIALMRVENLLPIFFDDALVQELGRAKFVGPFVHVPLIGAGMVIALFTRTLGFHWLALLIVAAELTIVITRFVFSYEQALMADLVRYWYAALFLFASAYTLFEEGHVRVDILYAGFGRTRKGLVNAIGSILLGTSTAWVILWIGFNNKQAIINSPLINFEVTQSGSTGLFVKYQMAGFLALFAITMLIQFISYFFEAIADFRDEPGHRDTVAAAH